MKKYNLLVFIFLLMISACQKQGLENATDDEITVAAQLIGLEFTPSERDSMREGLNDNKELYQQIREYALKNAVRPALVFNPVPVNYAFKAAASAANWDFPQKVELPSDKAKIAYLSIRELAYLIKNKKISSVQLTQIYLERIEKFDPHLKAFISLTKDLALEQAARADKEIAAGKYRGPLHGIPYGIKDLFAVKGTKTTWGAVPYKNQELDYTASVVKKLEEAGAVLLGKLSLGALAWGDVWFDATTKNPWNLEQGSSGSSAGPASATSGGLVAFAIGSETWGSIVSPSTRCGASGLRPTFGRVSKYGAMALSWSMDKLGPICRSAYDCALVFDVIQGKDALDISTIQAPFVYNNQIDYKKLKVGYLKSLFDESYRGKNMDSLSLLKLRQMGAELIATELPKGYPVEAMSIILSAEAAAAFDLLTRSGEDDKMVRQVINAWPNVFRTARFIPAVEYINANRIRTAYIEEFNRWMKEFDVIVAPSFGGEQLLATNLTGHPAALVPNGFDEKGSPTSISFLGNLFDEATILAFANAYQQSTDIKDLHPEWLMK